MKSIYLMVTVFGVSASYAIEDLSFHTMINKCSNSNMIQSNVGFSCLGNSGRIYTKNSDNNLVTNDGVEWVSPKKGNCFDYEQAQNYCKSSNSILPNYQEVEILKKDFVDVNTGKMNPMFEIDKSCCRLDSWVWVLTPADSGALRTIWDLSDGHFGGYWPEYKHNVLCKK